MGSNVRVDTTENSGALLVDSVGLPDELGEALVESSRDDVAFKERIGFGLIERVDTGEPIFKVDVAVCGRVSLNCCDSHHDTLGVDVAE